MTFGGPEMIIVLVLVLVLFGGSQLPKLARNLGKAQKEFKDGIADADGKNDGPGSNTSATNTSATDSSATGTSTTNAPTNRSEDSSAG